MLRRGGRWVVPPVGSCRRVRIRRWRTVRAFGPQHQLGGNVRLEIDVLLEPHVVAAGATVEDLQRDLDRRLRLTREPDDGLHAFEDLPLDDCVQGQAGVEEEHVGLDGPVAEGGEDVVDEVPG